MQGGKDAKEKEKPKKQAVSARTDRVEISSEAKAMLRGDAEKGPVSVLAMKLKAEGPLVRDAKVAAAQENLRNKIYDSKLSDVAEGVLKDLLG